ncbi:MAG: class I SAM-dependent methyltransferase [Candidatus Bathyarchaeota archaeon]|nr:class I SAM-dependent methyltransferase [Candidatus Bathyarchaeota archaeon]MDH5787409.1 class I SAM-dependent methyltransferase [Candidatus Bathyarchaeota archaeon]
MQFEEEYFKRFRYSQREHLIRRYVLEVLKWGSEVSNSKLLDGHGKTALDVGCAYGYAVDVLKSLGYDACGIDVSKHGARHAKKTYSPSFVVCDVQRNLPFLNGIFDLVTCFQVLEHLPHPLRAIKNAFSSCRNVMICTTPNKAVEKPVKKLVKDFDKTHINLRAPEEWRKYLKNFEHSIVKVEPFFDASLRVADRLLFFKSFRLPYFGLDTRILIKR